MTELKSATLPHMAVPRASYRCEVFRMSAEEKLLERGAILAGLEDVKEQIDLQRGKAKRIGDAFRRVAHLLETAPERIVLQNEETSTFYSNDPLLDAKDVNLETVLTVRNAIRSGLDRQRELGRRKDGA